MLALAAALLGALPPCGPLDLETAKQLALTRSDELAIRRAEVVIAEADRSIARAAGILPMSSATLVVGPVPEARGTILAPASEQRTLAGLGPFVRFDATVVQPLWTWGQLTSARQAADAGKEARELLVDDLTRQIAQRVLQLYYAAALTRKLLAIAAEVESALNQVELRVAESLAKGDGEVTQEDKFRVMLFRAELEQRRAEGEKALALARAGLAGVLAIEERALVLEEKALPPAEGSPPDLEQVIREALGARPDLRALDAGIRAKTELANVARAAVYPTLFLAGSFSFAYAPNRDEQNNPWALDPFNTLSGGIVLGLRQNLSIASALADAEKAEAEVLPMLRQRDGLTRLIRFEVEEAHAGVVAAQKKVRATRSAVTAGKGWFRSSQLNFGLNLTDAKSLLDAYTGYVKTQLDASQATYEFLVAFGRLDQVTARDLPKGGATCALF